MPRSGDIEFGPTGGLPVFPQLRLAGHRLVMGDEAACGGDWCDAVALGRGRVALALGEGAGSGDGAAAAQDQVRDVLIEALDGNVPAAQALARLHRFACRSPSVTGARVAVAVIDPVLRTVQYGGFGHPTPLVVNPSGATRFLPATPSSPLGVAARPPPVASARLSAREVLLFYSPGVRPRADRSARDAPDDLDRVLAAAVSQSRMTPDRLCAEAVRWLVSSGHPRNAAVCAAELRVEPIRPLVLVLPAEGTSLRVIRRALSDWLHDVGAGDEDVSAVHLAVVEAATNCVEHAYAGSGGRMWVDAVLDGAGQLQVIVTDCGQWRHPRPASKHRGRGLRLMHSLMDAVLVFRSNRGTTVTMSRTLQHPVGYYWAAEHSEMSV